ncbi:hypothetical protein, partial [Mycobacterium sp. 1274761.0]|uniref:hypothetical protein n=1 Tax=Mycobacterium sp. 1274761.0 TaxID=1834077 RepID=UPI000A966D3D
STFGIHVPAVRREFAKFMNDCGAEVAVLDCVRPVLDAHGLSEDKDCGRFLEAWDELMSEAGVSESIVIHHMGHQNERARGDSRLLDWPDVNWRLLKANQAGQPKSADPFDLPADDYGGVRVFTANGRDVDIPRGALDFDPATRRYTYRDLGAANLAADTRWLKEILIAEPGLGVNKTIGRLKAVAHVPYKRAQSAIWCAIQEGTVEQADGPNKSKPLTWIGGPE